jgi:hypothetical protein
VVNPPCAMPYFDPGAPNEKTPVLAVAPSNAKGAEPLKGNVGSSTFRFTLAALLIDALALRPFMRRTKSSSRRRTASGCPSGSGSTFC